MVAGAIRPIAAAEWLMIALHFKKIKCPLLKHLARKIRALDYMKNRVETLVLGSSHAQMGWIANGNEFNLGIGYQDLYYTYELYSRYKNCPNLKTIVVFYSVFSQGHQLIRTKDARICITFKAVANIDYEDWGYASALRLNWLLGSYRRKAANWCKSHRLDKNDFGNEYDYIPVKTKTASERALPHLKNNNRQYDMSKFLDSLAKDTEERNQRLIFVIPPATKEYRNALPEYNLLFGNLARFMQQHRNVMILNHFNDDRFSSSDFIDWDHLSLEGANKLTDIVRREMCNG